MQKTLQTVEVGDKFKLNEQNYLVVKNQDGRKFFVNLDDYILYRQNDFCENLVYKLSYLYNTYTNNLEAYLDKEHKQMVFMLKDLSMDSVDVICDEYDNDEEGLNDMEAWLIDSVFYNEVDSLSNLYDLILVEIVE